MDHMDSIMWFELLRFKRVILKRKLYVVCLLSDGWPARLVFGRSLFAALAENRSRLDFRLVLIDQPLQIAHHIVLSL